MNEVRGVGGAGAFEGVNEGVKLRSSTSRTTTHLPEEHRKMQTSMLAAGPEGVSSTSSTTNSREILLNEGAGPKLKGLIEGLGNGTVTLREFGAEFNQLVNQEAFAGRLKSKLESSGRAGLIARIERIENSGRPVEDIAMRTLATLRKHAPDVLADMVRSVYTEAGLPKAQVDAMVASINTPVAKVAAKEAIMGMLGTESKAESKKLAA